MSLTDYFLEDPSNIHCIEGEDATFSCKIQPNSALVEWLKDGNKIESSDNCIVSKDDSQHELKLLNTKLKDNGEYCVQVESLKENAAEHYQHKRKPENNDVNLRKETSVSIAVHAENPSDVISEKDDLTAKMTDEKMNDIIWKAKAKTEKEKNTSEDLIECGIWDFAGQRDYYASHQTFFTPHAIYLLVADISEDIKDINYDGNVDYNSIEVRFYKQNIQLKL
ncbi:unnamed protein product [Mytilus edulis]|uniref:Ig-like domain-containing protein n=1 Tax=Mytilus edulis TaxID=6550 RepID=A0A8S3S6N5_MYTED|nr:unnamed protein product [Mytilus edulis]